MCDPTVEAPGSPFACIARPVAGSILSQRCAWIAILFTALAACGGGGGVIAPEPPAPTIVDGLSGRVLLPDFDLGRVIEQEPNDAAGQAFDVAPLWPRCTLEIAGDLATTAARYGRVDLMDVLRLVSSVDQNIAVELTFESLDPLTGNPNNVTAAVVDVRSGVELTVGAPGAQPLTLAFDATADAAYDLILTIPAGHAWYVVRLVGSDLPPAPAPPSTPKPIAGSDAASGAESGEAPAASTAPRPAAAPRCAGDHLLVRFDDACDPTAFCSEHGLELGRRTATGSYLVHFGCDGGEGGQQKAMSLGRSLAALPGVRWADPDWVLTAQSEPDDALYNRQWNLRAVGAPSAWDVVTGDASIIVGVLDSGVIDHPDLAGQTVPGYDFISDPLRAGDGGGRDPDPTDEGDRGDGSGLSVWHGTHVAAIIAAKQDDRYGVTGIAPGVRLMILRALGAGGGLVSDAAAAILYAAGLHETADGRKLDTPLPVLNLSVGLAQDHPDLRDACNRAANNGVLLVGAVGNSGGPVLYPAAYPSVLAVAAVDGGNMTTQYSNHGGEVDIAAPGGALAADRWNDGWRDGVLSAVRDETVEPAVYAHAYIVGTSQAAPHVAGAAALLLSLDPTLNAVQLKQILTATTLDLGVVGKDVAYGSGLLQVHEAVKSVLESLGNPRADPAALQLPTRSIQFDDFVTATTFIDVPIQNGGGGRLNLFDTFAYTVDGGNWLSATLVTDSNPGSPSNTKEIVIAVNRAMVPSGPGRYSGFVTIGNSAGVLDAIRVVLYVNQQTRAGQHLPVIATEIATGVARRRALASADRGYRYWFRGLPPGDYTLRAGEDLDGDGFFCESFEACGWFGGPLESDAVPVPYVEEEPAIKGLGILLAPQPPP